MFTIVIVWKLKNHNKTTLVSVYFVRLIENILNGNASLRSSPLFSFYFFFFLVLAPQNRAPPMVLLASKLMKSLCCVSIYNPTETGNNWGKEGKLTLVLKMEALRA